MASPEEVKIIGARAAIDILSYDELQIISKTYFSDLKGAPKAGILTDFPRADEFDREIRGCAIGMKSTYLQNLWIQI